MSDLLLHQNFQMMRFIISSEVIECDREIIWIERRGKSVVVFNFGVVLAPWSSSVLKLFTCLIKKRKGNQLYMAFTWLVWRVSYSFVTDWIGQKRGYRHNLHCTYPNGVYPYLERKKGIVHSE